MAGRPHTILFVARSAAFFHYFQSLLDELVARGHRLRCLYDPHWTKTYPGKEPSAGPSLDAAFTFGAALRRNDAVRNVLFFTRELLSYRRYLGEHRQSTYYRDRWAGYLRGKDYAYGSAGLRRNMSTARPSPLAAAIEEARAHPAYQAYLTARAHVVGFHLQSVAKKLRHGRVDGSELIRRVSDILGHFGSVSDRGEPV